MPTRTKIEGLPIQQEWSVVGVREGAVESNPNGGDLQKFYVDFDGAPDVYWRRKLPATVEVGKTYFGTISEGNHGPIFKKETPQSGGAGAAPRTSSAGSGSSSSGRTFKPESEFDPEKVARMGRAHAQEMAVRTLVAMGSFEGKSADRIHVTLKGWIDWFQADVDSAGSRAKGQSPPASSSPPPAPPATQEAPSPSPAPEGNGTDQGERDTFVRLLENQAVPEFSAQKLAALIMRCDRDQRVRAHNGLADPETQVATLEELRKSYEEAEGEPVPVTDPEETDDIPF